IPLELARVFDRVLSATHLSRPSDIGDELVRDIQLLGATDVVFYVPDYAQEVLIPVPAESSPKRDEHSIEGTMLGRAYTTMSILQAPTTPPSERARVWMPLLDGTDRLGALELT